MLGGKFFKRERWGGNHMTQGFDKQVGAFSGGRSGKSFRYRSAESAAAPKIEFFSKLLKTRVGFSSQKVQWAAFGLFRGLTRIFFFSPLRQ